MATCSVRWRASGGRGEFEYVPVESLEDRIIDVYFEWLNIRMPSEVMAVKAQRKPRLRKFENNRRKLHLPQLVMAVARFPDPAREMTKHAVIFPLQNKSFVMDSMDFDIIEDDGMTATLSPLRVSIRNSDVSIDLQDRFRAISTDLERISEIEEAYPDLAIAVRKHGDAVKEGVNSTEIRIAANEVNNLQKRVFGLTNAGSVIALKEASAKPETDFEHDIQGMEGRLLARIHIYKERDRVFSEKVKKYFRDRNNGKLICQACGLEPTSRYGSKGDYCIEAHHKIPIAELQPGSITRIEEMAIVCASCHRIIHSKKPCLDLKEVIRET
jgi:hypothetical protein